MIFTFTGDCSAVRHKAAILHKCTANYRLGPNHRMGFNESECVNRQLIDTRSYWQFKCNLQITLEMECLNSVAQFVSFVNDASFLGRAGRRGKESRIYKRCSCSHTLRMCQSELCVFLTLVNCVHRLFNAALLRRSMNVQDWAIS